MTDKNNPSFAAIITITSPESNELSRLRVMLLPADLVPLEGGVTKPLQDCTLAELQQFAESLEKKLWDQHGSDTLIDLVVGGQAEITINLAGDDSAESQSMDLWLAHAIVFPESETPEKATGDDAGKESVVDNQLPEQDPDPDTTVDIHLIDKELPAQRVDPVIEAETAEITPATTTSTAVDEAVIEVQPGDEDIVAGIKEESPEITTGTVATEETDGSVEDLGEAAVTRPGTPEIQAPGMRVLGLRRPLNHGTWTAVDILTNEPAFRDAQAHSLSSMDREVAGVLIGPQPEKQPDGRYVVHIVDTIIAKHTRMHGASVTYTPESWRYVNDKLAERYPDESAVIVGWYHTHPGFGIFLSGMDLFIHQNFFTQKWHVALVLDPQARRSGFFCWDRQMTKVDTYDFPWPKWASGSW
jgi:proteasome lid subunit RPN8/RPN11